MVAFENFEQLDIRVGTVTGCAPFPKARKPAYKLWIDFGEMGILQSSAQITERYATGELMGTQVIAVVNFPPRLIAGFSSQCLVLGIYAENNEVVLLRPDQRVGNGLKIG